ncbi:MAG: ATP-binding protein [Acidobacteriota bacterium]|nr:ATP-binding protein [Acidobacteriota bacterium]
MSADHSEWLRENQRALMAAVARVRAQLEKRELDDDDDAGGPALDRVTEAFGLSSFERNVLMLCAAVELDGTFGAAIATAAGDSRQTRPTFGLALATFEDAHWSALMPSAALRRWQLIEVDASTSITAAPLRISERVLHYLTGVSHMDERWSALVTPVERPAAPLPPSHGALTQEITLALEHSPLIELTGNDPAGKRDVAAMVAAATGARLYAVAAAELPQSAHDRDTLSRLWEREAILGNAALLIDAGELQPDARRATAAFLDRARMLTFVAAREPLALPHARMLRYEVNKPPFDEQRALWIQALGARAAEVDGEVDRLAAHFDLSARSISVAAAATEAEGGVLWNHCRVAARSRLQDLAHRVDSVARAEELILPPGQHAVLRQIIAHVRQRAKVYEEWGFAARGARGLGISALFAGPSGTGKTMAAEVLANELRLDLYVIDLSSVVSKYIGETEQNLRRVFDAAEEGGAILLFDEADALFGKRTEVKDSHDRYANIEVSYLLQRMETYRGVAILTTNTKSALDTAFLRRIRFVVEFPFPDPAHRAAIWHQAFPSAVPRSGLDPAKLARLNVAGGNIRNIALNAAFLAAEAGESVRMSHVLAATRSEYAKLERPLTDSEIAGWL